MSVVHDSVLPRAMLKRLQLPENRLTTLPRVATQAIEATKDTNVGLDELIEIVRRDPVLTANVLRAANTIARSTGTTLQYLEPAVVRLGVRECRGLIIAACRDSAAKRMTLEEEWVREALSLHSFTTAILSMKFNRALNIGFQGEEFTAGLVHDVGRMVLATSCRDKFADFDPMDFIEEPGLLVVEDSVIATTHCEIGVWFAVQNSLPDSLIAVIRHHHTPELASPGDRRLVALIAACDHMANHVQRNDDASAYDPGENSALLLLEQSGFPNLTQQFETIGQKMMNSAKRDAVEMLAS